VIGAHGLLLIVQTKSHTFFFSQVSVKEAKKTVDLWYNDRKEVLRWQEERKREAHELHCVYTLLGRARRFPLMAKANTYQKGHIERAAINTPVQVLNSFY
jgi:DNA polymerase-1